MFDTFDILLPTLRQLPPVAVRNVETAFGIDNTRYVYVGDVRVGRIELARVAFGDVAAWAGSLEWGGWTVLLAREEANVAVQSDAAWRSFLDGVRTILVGHTGWRVTCESDCDQHELENLKLTADSLVELLDSYRARGHFPIAFRSEAGLGVSPQHGSNLLPSSIK